MALVLCSVMLDDAFETVAAGRGGGISVASVAGDGGAGKGICSAGVFMASASKDSPCANDVRLSGACRDGF